MIDRTQEDINQDLRIADIEQRQRGLSNKLETSIGILGSHTSLIGKHEGDLRVLNPLKAVVEHIEAIKDFFTNIRSIRR